MTVHVDASALVDALTGPRRSLDVLIGIAGEGHRLSLSAIVLYEWLRGPRTRAELAVQEDLFPRARAVPFGAEQAAIAARLYGVVKRPRGAKLTWRSLHARSTTVRRSGPSTARISGTSRSLGWFPEP